VTLAVRVEGGTDAGRRVIREPARDWTHTCREAATNVPYGRLLEAAYARCPSCGAKRP
jgi:hypothetical protein